MVLFDLPEDYFKHLKNLITYATILFNLLQQEMQQLRFVMKFFMGGHERVVAVQIRAVFLTSGTKTNSFCSSR